MDGTGVKVSVAFLCLSSLVMCVVCMKCDFAICHLSCVLLLDLLFGEILKEKHSQMLKKKQ